MAALDDDPDAGLAAPALVLPDGARQESPRRFYDLASVLARRTGFGRSRAGRRAVARHLMTGEQPDPGGVDWVTGAAMLIDRDAIAGAGPFDERYFLYFEDVDLCRRLRAQGRTVRYEPTARVRHRFGRGSRRQVPWNPLLWHHLRSGLLYALRWSLAWWSGRGWRAAGRAALGAIGRAALLTATAWILVGSSTALPLALARLLVLRPVRGGRLGRPPLPGLPGNSARLAVAGSAGLALAGEALGVGVEPLRRQRAGPAEAGDAGQVLGARAAQGFLVAAGQQGLGPDRHGGLGVAQVGGAAGHHHLVAIAIVPAVAGHARARAIEEAALHRRRVGRYAGLPAVQPVRAERQQSRDGGHAAAAHGAHQAAPG